MALDFGIKRTGIAVTDPLQIIATGLETVDTDKLVEYLEKYFRSQAVEKVVFGLPTHKDGNFTYLKKDIDKMAEQILKLQPSIEIDFEDESFSSSYARDIIMASGVNKKKRRDKAHLDKVSAVVILQRYLKHI